MPEEDHGSVVLQSHYWGLRKIFNGWKLTKLPGNLDELKAHYAKLSQRMGFAVPCPEFTANQVGYLFLGQGRRDEALAVFRFNVESYPGSPNVYDSLGEMQEQAGQREEALANYTRAAEIGRKTADPRTETYVRNRDRLAVAKK